MLLKAANMPYVNTRHGGAAVVPYSLPSQPRLCHSSSQLLPFQHHRTAAYTHHFSGVPIKEERSINPVNCGLQRQRPLLQIEQQHRAQPQGQTDLPFIHAHHQLNPFYANQSSSFTAFSGSFNKSPDFPVHPQPSLSAGGNDFGSPSCIPEFQSQIYFQQPRVIMPKQEWPGATDTGREVCSSRRFGSLHVATSRSLCLSDLRCPPRYWRRRLMLTSERASSTQAQFWLF